MAKSFFKLDLHAPALVWFDRIAKGPPDHLYRASALIWVTSVLDRAPNTAARAVLESYEGAELGALKSYGEAINAAHYELGHLATLKDDKSANRFLGSVAPTSRYAARAHLDLAVLAFRRNDVDAGMAYASAAAANQVLAPDAVREIALATHSPGAVARAADAYRKLSTAGGPAAPFAREELARLEVGTDIPPLASVPLDEFDALALSAVCIRGEVDDAKPVLREALTRAEANVDRLLAIEDDSDLYETLLKLGSPKDPTAALLRFYLSFDKSIREMLGWRIELEREGKLLRTTGEALRNSGVGGDALQEIVLQQSLVTAELGRASRARLATLRTGLRTIDQILATVPGALPIAYGTPRAHAMFVSLPSCTRAFTVAASMDSSPVPIPAAPPRGCGGCGTTDAPSTVALSALAYVLGFSMRARRKKVRSQ